MDQFAPDRGADSGGVDRGAAETFLKLHAQNQHRLSAFVHTLVPNWQDAEELIQDTLVVLWRKFDEFDPQTNFFAWAARVAQLQVANYRRRAAVRRQTLSDEAFNTVAAAAAQQMGDLDLRREALEGCVQQLGLREREILQLRYRDGSSAEKVAEALQKSAGHVRRVLGKIRQRLHRCVELKLNERRI